MAKILLTLGLVCLTYFWINAAFIEHSGFKALFDFIKTQSLMTQLTYGVQFYFFAACVFKFTTGLLFFKLFLFYPVSILLIYLDFPALVALYNDFHTGTFDVKTDLGMAAMVIGPPLATLGVLFANFLAPKPEGEKNIRGYIRI